MPHADSDRTLTKEELDELTRNLQRLSQDRVERAYRQAHQDARFNGRALPPAHAVQKLVAAWRVLRR